MYMKLDLLYEGNRLKVFENRAGEYCIVLSFVTFKLMVSKSSRTNWTGHVAYTVKARNAYRISVTKPEGMELLGRFTHL
jgi:hypothetical protein